ncbi:MAG: hypothetical protein SPL54_06525, partial [Lachnospiraceae bacterium]|nr:hypothetical protein [Lachnospiraceae bacterium]
MEEYKKEFIDFMVECNVLRFGEFTLKSGRKSPFFMNAGLYQSGSQLSRLGEFYARAIHDKYGTDFDVLFGPAYKGIPLAVATVQAVARQLFTLLPLGVAFEDDGLTPVLLVPHNLEEEFRLL